MNDAQQSAPALAGGLVLTARFFPFLKDLLLSSRAGWTPKSIALAWVGILPLFLLDALWRGLRSGLPVLPESFGGWVLLLGLGALGLIWLVGACGTLSAMAGWEYGRECRWSVPESFGQVRSRLGSMVISTLSAPLVLLIAGAIPWTVCFLLGRIPWGVGKTCSIIFLATLGLPFAGMAAGFILLGLPATPIMVPAAALDSRDIFETVSRCISYLRSRPLKYFLAFALALVAGCVSAAVACAFWFCFFGFLLLVYMFGTEPSSSGGFADAFGSALSGARLLWPLDAAGPSIPGGAAGSLWTAALLGAAGRLVTASWLAALVAGATRIYLYLRWEIDQEPPSCLIRDDEKFTWSHESFTPEVVDEAIKKAGN